MSARVLKPEEYFIEKEPYYEPIGDEVEVFEAAYRQKLPVLLKGPTGCGKTRFMEYMAWRLKKPLITVSCHDDLTASDLVGRYLVKGGETTWVDGPLTSAVRAGGICYLADRGCLDTVSGKQFKSRQGDFLFLLIFVNYFWHRKSPFNSCRLHEYL